MSRPIFLCYRRTDSSVAGRVRDAIRYRFGDESVYMDTSASAAGERWPTALENAIDGADVVIVVISPNWITQGDEWGRRRIDQAGDWVRREIELALTAQKPIVPLLVGEARMPPKEAFPVEIAGLTEWQARRLNDESWDHLIEPLLDELASLTSQSVGSSTAPPRHAGQDGETIRKEFQVVASRFYDAPVDERIAAAEEIAGIGGLLELDDVLRFAGSRMPAERVGAAIAIAAHLRSSEQLRGDPRVQSALRALLNDPRSRVRYRAAEVLRGFPALVPAYESDLRWLAESDENSYVQSMAQKALDRAARRA